MLDNYRCNLILLFVNRMITYKRIRKIPISKRSIKRSIKPVNYTVHDKMAYIGKLFDKSQVLDPRYLTNPKNSHRMNEIISKLNKKLPKIEQKIPQSKLNSKEREQYYEDIAKIRKYIKDLKKILNK